MKKNFILTTGLLLLMLLPMNLKAYDFSYTYQGKTLYYNIVNGDAQVTSQNNDFPYYSSYPTGDIVIPTTVTNDDVTYTVTSIGDNAFYNCRNITSVSIPNTVTTIGNSAFCYCNIMTLANIPDAITTIGNTAFAECQALESITLPSTLTHIGYEAFSDCYSLTTLYIPSSVTFIGDGTFARCKGLTSIIVDSDNPNYDSRNNCNAIIQTDSNILLTGCSTTVIPNTVTLIGNDAFSYSNITSITIPNSVTAIGEFAFYRCYELESVTIGDSVATIGMRAFDNCTTLTSIVIPNSVTSIGSKAFYNCRNLKLAILSNSIDTIHSYTFYGCDSLTSIVIPNSVDNINGYAFYGCRGLRSVTIGSAVTSISTHAFEGCRNLEEIISLATVAPTLARYFVFTNVPDTIPVYIPCGSIESYQSGWTYFSNFVEDGAFDFDYTITTSDSTQGSVVITVYPTCQTPTVEFEAVPDSGYRFDHWSDGDTVNPRVLELTSDTVILAYFTLDTIIDTIIDTVVVVGVDAVDAINSKIYTINGRIVVDGAEGNIVWLYDVNGRMLAKKRDEQSPLQFDVPASGAYLVKIGNHSARKVVVIR